MQSDRPRIKRSYTVVGHGADVVELRQGAWNATSYTLNDEGKSGRLYRVLKRLDGSVSTAQIARDESIARSEVEAIVDHLMQLDVLETGPCSALDYYVDQMVPSLKSSGWARPQQRRVTIVGDTSLTTPLCDLVRRSLEERAEAKPPHVDDVLRKLIDETSEEDLYDALRFQRCVEKVGAWADAFVVLIQERVDPRRCVAFNRLAQAAKIPWMHVAMDGPFLLIGPTFTPPHSGCYECLETRALMNLREGASYVAYKDALLRRQVIHGAMPLLPALHTTVIAHTALEVANFVATGTNFTATQVLSIYMPTMAFAYHEVLKVPECAGCGSVSERDEQDLYFDLRHLLEPSDA
ncbi:TOMM precursor leader peptide-binding protein [Sorangium sp. So ce1000]|uniref:TOMM precursor leader peptide-binding protein n=1 Tax=Sorangium sp. So ce1000 TaxID=3133325 RepID=UPI003F5EF402